MLDLPADAPENAAPADAGEAEAGDIVIGSTTLARLFEEVRNDEPSEPHAYNRMHNRHNR